MLAWKSNSVTFWSNFMSVSYIYLPTTLLSQDRKLTHDERLEPGFTKKMGQLDTLPLRYGVLLTFFTCYFVSNFILSLCLTGGWANLLNGNSGSNDKVKCRLLSENIGIMRLWRSQGYTPCIISTGWLFWLIRPKNGWGLRNLLFWLVRPKND